MEIELLLTQLRERRVRLWADETSRLRVDAPKGVLTPELQEALRERKVELIELLKTATPSSNEWARDVGLPEDFRVANSSLGREPQGVLLTGATGFLGKYLLRELLCQTSLKIFCLVRPTGEERVEKELRKSKVWEESFASRLKVIEADLAEPSFGFSQEIYHELIRKVDLVFHNGAQVHHGLPYASLRDANVGGTLALLELAAAARASFHFVSSLSVLPSMTSGVAGRFFESDPLEKVSPPRGGYNLTKWVAERLVEQAGGLGMETVIYRPGPISGDSVTGEFNRQDFLCRLVQGYVASGSAPSGKTLLDLLPVDFTARSMVWLATRSSLRGEGLRRYHLLHSKPASSELLFDACARAGFKIQRVPYQDWFRTLTEVAGAGQRDHPLYPLAGLFSSRGEEAQKRPEKAKEVPYDSRETEAALREAPFALPALDEALFDRYLIAMIRQGGVVK